MVTADDITDEVVEEEEEEKCPMTHSEAAHMFEQCLTWLEHQPEANQYNTSSYNKVSPTPSFWDSCPDRVNRVADPTQTANIPY